jgi:small subunit ribosomal protein S19e
MTTIYDVDGNMLVASVAKKLKESGIKKPAYVDIVKSSAGRERPPSDDNFWYMRCASILRTVYISGPIGISRLRTKYGSNQAHKRSRHHQKRSGGSMIKDAFDVLESHGYVKKNGEGRVITAKGKSLLDKTSSEIARGLVHDA